MARVRAGFDEVADRVWVARYDWFDLNVTLVGGDAGLVVVDTHASTQAALGVIQDIRRLGVGDVTAVVNTHEHFDHTFGNDAFATAYDGVPIFAHEVAAAATLAAGEAAQARFAARPDDPGARQITETRLRPADQVFSSVQVLDLGDRRVELLHPGRGHTGGDLIVVVPEVDVLLAGDLVEESGPPAYAEDSFPLEWPATLDVIGQLTSAHTRVVPGHGAPVGREFLERQRGEVGQVAQQIHDLAAAGVPLERAFVAATWPFPETTIREALRRGYPQLPNPSRQLPLV